MNMKKKTNLFSFWFSTLQWIQSKKTIFLLLNGAKLNIMQKQKSDNPDEEENSYIPKANEWSQLTNQSATTLGSL